METKADLCWKPDKFYRLAETEADLPAPRSDIQHARKDLLTWLWVESMLKLLPWLHEGLRWKTIHILLQASAEVWSNW